MIAGVLFLAGYRAVYKAIFDENSPQRHIIMCSIPYMVIMGGYLFANIYELSKNGYTGDVGLVWNMAISFFPFTFVYLSGLYLLCFFLIPVFAAPTIIKVIFLSLVVGYIVYRTKNYYGTKWAYLLYAVFMLQPVQSSAVQVHRMHWYAVLYLFISVKLFFDGKENVEKDKDQKSMYLLIFFLSAALSFLAIWRREGFYLLLAGPVLLLAVYQQKKKWKQIVLIFVAVSIVIWTPRLLYEKDHTLEDAGIVWQSYAVHMLADASLNRADYPEELKAIGAVLDLNKVDLYNAEKGDSGYAEAYWAFTNYENDRYHAVRQGLTDEHWRLFRKAVFSLSLKEPMVFVKSRIRGFCFVAGKYDPYNLFAPLLMCFLILLYSILKKEKMLGIWFVCLIFHTGLTVIFMPVAYFKYFFEMYLCAYTFFFIVLLSENIRVKRNSERDDISVTVKI